MPHDKGEVINLTNRYNGGVFLLQIAPGSLWFKLSGDNYTRLIGDPIEAFDPDGGPCVKLGDNLSSRVVKEIVFKDGVILVKLV